MVGSLLPFECCWERFLYTSTHSSGSNYLCCSMTTPVESEARAAAQKLFMATLDRETSTCKPPCATSQHSANAQMVFINSEWPMTKDGYDLNEQIGVGGLNKVWTAKCNTNKQIVAVKQIDLSEQSSESRDRISKEVQGMSLVAKVPNVVQFFCSFVDADLLWIVMELMDGSLLDVLKWKFPCGITDELLVAALIRETLRGLTHLHHHTPKFIHRDVKAGNILYDNNGKIALADFGVSAVLQTHDEKRTTMAGTWHWMAPEVVDPTDYGGYDEKADIWSLGITAIELAFSCAPYSAYRPNQVVLFILQNPPPTLSSPSLDDSLVDGRTFSKSFHDFVRLCLQHHPKKRPTAAKLLRSKFFEKVPKDCTTMLKEGLFQGLPPAGDRFRQAQEKKKQSMLKDSKLAQKMSRTKKKGLSESTRPKRRKESLDKVGKSSTSSPNMMRTQSKKERSKKHNKEPCPNCNKSFSKDGMKVHLKICSQEEDESFSDSDEILDF